MAALRLKEAFLHLSQHSADSVQNGTHFTAWDDYMHVDRPIENQLCARMDEIDRAGGGIVILVGSAGDGKSHLLSRVRQMSDWGDENFYNDATASSSPKKTAVDTLKEALIDFNDANLQQTHRKMVLAINLGKLNALIGDEDFKMNYGQIVDSTWPIFDNDDTTPPIDKDRVKVVMFVDQQSFEFYADPKGYRVESDFLSKIMEKIVNPQPSNPFYNAYKDDLKDGVDPKDPLILNFELLSLPAVRHTIVMSIIEAIVRFKMNITPREMLDFLYSIMVYPQNYREKNDFFEALLPSLLYCGRGNLIQRALCHLDPLKQSSTEHDEQLAVLFTSYAIPDDYFENAEIAMMPPEMIKRTNAFYGNNGRDIERTTKFVFRLKHVLNYHSESKVYTDYLNLLNGIYLQDKKAQMAIYKMVAEAIPRHSGSYYSKPNMIPLNIQGGRYRLFGQLQLKPELINPHYSDTAHNDFLLRFDMSWSFPDKPVTLRMDYPLYAYLSELNRGKLALSYENEKNLAFSKFIRQLVEKCNCEQEITVVRANMPEITLSESPFGNIELV